VKIGHRVSEHRYCGLEVRPEVVFAGFEGVPVHRVRCEGFVNDIEVSLAEAFVEYAVHIGFVALELVHGVSSPNFIPVRLERILVL
jgi:hypothetical protein